MGQGFESLLAHMVGVAQLVEHLVVAQVVEGSIPFTHLILESLLGFGRHYVRVHGPLADTAQA